MSDIRQCSHCGGDLQKGDRFCPLCGQEKDPSQAGTEDQSPVTCPQCGHPNNAEASVCKSCGGALARRGAKSSAANNPITEPKSSISFFASWKFTLTAAGILALLVVIFLGGAENAGTPAITEDPHSPGMMQQIQMYRQRIESNPADTAALLGYGNLLFDLRFYAGAIEMYSRYLSINPSNPDARVDMGIAYFELSLADTADHSRNLQSALTALETALGYSPRHQMAHFNLGIIHLHQGDIAGARMWLNKCVEIDPASGIAGRAKEIIDEHIQQNQS